MMLSIRSTLVGLAATIASSIPAEAHTNLTYPIGGESFQVGQLVTIEWTVAIQHSLVGWDVLYSSTGAGGPFMPIAIGLPPGNEQVGSIHTHDWIVPDTPTTDARVLIRMHGQGGASWESMSSSSFEIRPSLGVRSCPNQNANSTGAPATMHLTGSATASANALLLNIVDLPTNTVGYPINSQTLGFVATPGGSQGNLCLGGSIGRHVSQVASSGAAGYAEIPLDLTQLPTLGGPQAAVAGETWSFQFWYRDANPQTTSNFSDAVSVTLL